MSDPLSRPSAAFQGNRLLRAGPLADVARAVKAASEAGAEAILVFEDATGRVIDLDLRGTAEEVVARLAPERGRGRPKLGVTAREVTLLPRHWDWLAAQPGGASAALRRLIDEARRREGEATGQRTARDAAYRFMSAMAGDLPGFEEAARALYADDPAGMAARMESWPADVRDYATRLAQSTKSAV